MKAHLSYIWGKQKDSRQMAGAYGETPYGFFSFLSLHKSTEGAENSWVCSRTVDQVSPSHGTRDGAGMKSRPCKNSTTVHPWAYGVGLEEQEGGRQNSNCRALALQVLN